MTTEGPFLSKLERKESLPLFENEVLKIQMIWRIPFLCHSIFYSRNDQLGHKITMSLF